MARLVTIRKRLLRNRIELGRQELARVSLIDFACYVDPQAAKWYRAEHLGRLAAALESVDSGTVKRLAISLPPRSWKSSLASEKFVAWYLARHQTHSVIIASHASTLAEKFSATIRDLIQDSENFHKLFPSIRIRQDSNQKADWLLETGVRSSLRAGGLDTKITGFGAHLFVIDDLFGTYQDAQSEVYREHAWDWYRGLMRGRLEPGGAIVIVNTRWHEADTIGHLIKAEREEGGEHYEVINIPVQQGGKWLWPERFSPEEYAALRSAVGESVWRTQYEGQTTQPGGNRIKREWFEYVPQLPEGVSWKVRAWDVAWTEKQSDKADPDFTASVAAVQVGNVTYLGLPRLFRKPLEEEATEILAMKMNEIGVRYGMGQSAIQASIVQAFAKAGFTIEPYVEHRDKVARASSWINRASGGHFKLVGAEEEWREFVAQWWSFPTGAHDDAVDAVSGISQMLHLTYDTWPKREIEKSPLKAFIDD